MVVGNAISRGNPELEYVLDERIPFCSLPQILHDEFLRGKEVLVVAGTHGKTTTTSMLAWIFHVGRKAAFVSDRRHRGKFRHRALRSADGQAFHPGRRRVRHRFLRQGPEVSALLSGCGVLTSVEFDHADIYKDLDAVETCVQTAREPGSAARTNHCVRYGEQSGDVALRRRSARSSATDCSAKLRYGESRICAWSRTRTSWIVLRG